MQLNADKYFTTMASRNKTIINKPYKLHDRPLQSTGSVKYLCLTLRGLVKLKKIRKKLGLARPHPPTPITIFLYFLVTVVPVSEKKLASGNMKILPLNLVFQSARRRGSRQMPAEGNRISGEFGGMPP